ncbi:sigma 54-interacting transcriptional regulator [bacterium]|nr:sigma 54-interacting transcriptional regulator [bacterium]
MSDFTGKKLSKNESKDLSVQENGVDPNLIDVFSLLGFGAALTLIDNEGKIAQLVASVIPSALKVELGAVLLYHNGEIVISGQFGHDPFENSLLEEIKKFIDPKTNKSSSSYTEDTVEFQIEKSHFPHTVALGLKRALLNKLKTTEREFGFVIAGKSSDEAFFPVQKAFLQAVASQAAIALHRLQLSQERKKAEQALRKAHDDLERRVEVRTEDLAKTNAKLNEEITERKRAAEALEQLRRHNELILSSAGEGIYGLDKEGNTTFVNPAAAQMLGWEADDLIGKPQHSIIHHTKPDGTPYPREECPIYAAFKDGLVHTVNDETFWRKDGTSIPVEYTSTPIRDDKNNLLGAVVTFRDITKRKQAERALRDALGEVEKLKDRLQVENVYLQEEIKLEYNFDEIISTSASFQKVLRNVEQVAATDATVLILGETGTGKELIARALHTTSPRSQRPLVKVNCASLPANLIESELFGHERGAFTGAMSRKQGRFELADGGTIFLDEIGDLPLDLQAKLLRVLQEGEFERVGGTQTLKVDVRVIAATNRDLKLAIQSGDFREDLFYRLNIFPITLPPLRERREDVPLLINHFVNKYGAKLGKKISQVPQKVMETLQAYHFPGNVRELENIIERAIILAKGETLQLDESLELLKNPSTHIVSAATLEDVERNHILSVLQETKWRIEGPKGAALRLAINPNTLRSRMQKLGIRKPL